MCPLLDKAPCHEDMLGEWRSGSMHSWPQHLMEVGCWFCTLATLFLGREPPMPIGWESGWALELVWTQWWEGISNPAGSCAPILWPVAWSLYWLSYHIHTRIFISVHKFRMPWDFIMKLQDALCPLLHSIYSTYLYLCICPSHHTWQPPDMRDGCKFVEWALVDSQQGGPSGWKLSVGLISNLHPSVVMIVYLHLHLHLLLLLLDTRLDHWMACYGLMVMYFWKSFSWWSSRFSSFHRLIVKLFWVSNVFHPGKMI
jgi:hypothetical protein